MTELLLLVGVAVLVAANGFFVAAEFALVRSRESRLEQLRDEGARGAALALRQIDHIDEYLSACQLGITMASLGIGFLGEPAIASLLEPVFGGGVSHGVAFAIAVAFAYLVTTALHITVGEQVPKIYSIVHPEGVARRTAPGLQLFRSVFNPLIWLLNSASNAMLRVVGVDPRAEFEEVSSSDDLKLIIARSTRGGKLDPGEAGMLSGVFHLHEQLARLLMTEGPGASIDAVVKEALIVPETKPLDDLLADLQRERASMAVVVDEYGRTAGIVTIEDIIEEGAGERVLAARGVGAREPRGRGADPRPRGLAGTSRGHDAVPPGRGGRLDAAAPRPGGIGLSVRRGDYVRCAGASPSRRSRMWCVRLSDAGRDALRELIRAQPEPGPALTAVLEALDLSRWDDLPEASLPWERVSELAEAQKIDEADVVWDLAAGMPPEPARAKRHPPRKAAKRAA